MKFGIASASLFPLPLHSVLKKASQAGFEFVEVFLLGKWTKEKVSRLIGSAAMLALELHWHQVWTTESSQKEKKTVNRILTALRHLPPEGYSRSEWVPQNARPLVAYAEEIQKFAGDDEVWFQSIASQRSLTSRSPRLSCMDFLREAQVRNLPIVFDTMHFIEYLRGESGIEHSAFEPEDILGKWKRFWVDFGPQVKEIHFNDFTKKRNLWPGTGTAPLQKFAKLVEQNGWDGCIVPEVRPHLPFPYGTRDLLALRKKVESYFA